MLTCNEGKGKNVKGMTVFFFFFFYKIVYYKNSLGFPCITFEALLYSRIIKSPRINHICYVLTLEKKHHNILKDPQLR